MSGSSNKTSELETSIELAALLEDERNKRRAVELELDDIKAQLNQSIEAGKMSSMAQIVSGVAHESNTPLSICIVSCSLLSDETHVLNDKFKNKSLSSSHLDYFIDKAFECESLINGNLKRLSLLIDTFKKLGSYQDIFSFQTINFPNTVAQIVSSLNTKYQETKYTVVIDDSMPFEAYTSMLCWQEIIEQLMENAMQHGFLGRNDNVIEILIYPSENEMTLLFCDNGNGMDKKICENIFSPFFSTTKYEGNIGIGMHLVYVYITHLLKGTISLNSTVGKGCEYIIIVPINHTSTQGG